jgi:hypothetical protein
VPYQSRFPSAEGREGRTAPAGRRRGLLPPQLRCNSLSEAEGIDVLTLTERGRMRRRATAVILARAPAASDLVDGQPLTCTSARAFPSNRIESVEVVKGEAAAWYGASPEGRGVIIQTKRDGYRAARGFSRFRLTARPWVSERRRPPLGVGERVRVVVLLGRGFLLRRLGPRSL